MRLEYFLLLDRIVDLNVGDPKARPTREMGYAAAAASIATGTHGLWVGVDGGLLTRLNPATGAAASCFRHIRR